MSSSNEKERLYLRLEVGMESEMLTPLGEHPPPGTHTHRWTVFVRGQNETQLDPKLVNKVVFLLHEDFSNPRRTVTSPPFEVTETGYAGFAIPIYIHFTNCKREYCLSYDMNLRYEQHVKMKETKTLEFLDPKPELRVRLIKAGAEVVPPFKQKLSSSSTPQSFEDVFGKPITVSHSEKPRSSPLDKKIVKAPSKPAPSSSSTSNSNSTTTTTTTTTNNSSSKLNGTNSHLKNGQSSEKNLNQPSTSGLPPHERALPSSSSSTSRSQDAKNSSKDETQNSSKSKDNNKSSKTHRTKSSSSSSSSADDKLLTKPVLKPYYFNDSVALTSSNFCSDDNKFPPPTKSPPPPSNSSSDCHHGQQQISNDNRHNHHHRSSSSMSHHSSNSNSHHNRHRSNDKNKNNNNNKRSQSKSPSSPVKITDAETTSAKSSSSSLKKRKKSADDDSGKKRAKTKSDSGMESDYSCANNASPSAVVVVGVEEQPSSVENATLSLFSPDSARSVDTMLHESSPSSAGSAVSTTSAVVNGHNTNDNLLKQEQVDESRLHSLVTLQRKIMTVREQSVAQKIADIVASAQHSPYECNGDNFEFDLFKLDSNIIHSLFKCFENETTSNNNTTR